jgi:sialic acid synthase SpsE
MAYYQIKNIGKEFNQRKMLRRLELREEFYRPIIQRCRERRILFLSTPHGGKESVNFLESLGMVAYKVGSGDLTNYLLLDRIAQTKKPVILSSGMATFREVKAAADFIRSRGNERIAVLHCTTNYPCSPDEVNLAAMLTLMKKLKCPVGYSDHTQGNQVAIMAATLGAAIYECHFTLDKKLAGPDHLASADPSELKEKINLIRKTQVVLGDGIKKPTKREKREMILEMRKSIVVTKSLPLGHQLTTSDLEAKRPGNGMSPILFEKIVGKILTKAIKRDEQLTINHLQI